MAIQKIPRDGERKKGGLTHTQNRLTTFCIGSLSLKTADTEREWRPVNGRHTITLNGSLNDYTETFQCGTNDLKTLPYVFGHDSCV